MNVRSKWKDEALNFTPWLAENLQLLGDALGMRLEYCQTEAPVGPFSLDILAREIDKDVKVAIENQLQETDHGHLGQLLTYAAEYNAQVAIWVASDFVYEHAKALHRLNEVAGEGIRFYGVKIEVIRKVGDACPEPRFSKVVSPGCWDRKNTLEKWERPPRIQRYHDFFQPLTTKLLGEGFADEVDRYYGPAGRFFPSRLRPETGYAVYLEGKEKNDAWVSLHVRTWDSIEQNNRIFDELKKAKPEIEESLDAEWAWHRFNPNSFFTISIRRDGSIDDTEKWEEIRARMLEQLRKLQEVLDPHLERVLRELQPEGADDDGGPAP